MPSSKHFRNCPGCGCKTFVTDAHSGTTYCDVCSAARSFGLDWKPIFDRDSGAGAIPPNLMARYGMTA